MDTFKSFTPQIYEVNADSFTDIALDVFRYQANANSLYKEFISTLRLDPSSIQRLEQIPFLPISFFKTHTIKTGDWREQTVYTSSGTTSQNTSKHFVLDEDFYLEHACRCFEHCFGPVKDYVFMALLPSYIERQGSSLIAMMHHFIEKSGSPYGGFFLDDYAALLRQIDFARQNSNKKIILWGVSFALLDLAESMSVDLHDCLVFETGGMKGRRRELTRHELHSELRHRFGVSKVYSEYGMTELFSQAYTDGSTTFSCPPQLRILGRDLTDPFRIGVINETSGINIVDLANWRTISFIETEDLGKVYPDGTFDISGRIDNSDIRGCNLLIH